jgi:hypothetical protein
MQGRGQSKAIEESGELAAKDMGTVKIIEFLNSLEVDSESYEFNGQVQQPFNQYFLRQ